MYANLLVPCAADSGDKQHQGVFKPEEGKIDKRHGDPEAGGKTSGQKVCGLICIHAYYDTFIN
jgi:hypothetical protein